MKKRRITQFYAITGLKSNHICSYRSVLYIYIYSINHITRFVNASHYPNPFDDFTRKDSEVKTTRFIKLG